MYPMNSPISPPHSRSVHTTNNKITLWSNGTFLDLDNFYSLNAFYSQFQNTGLSFIKHISSLKSDWVVCLAERISGSALPSLQGIYLKRCKSRAAKILKDSNHPGNHLFPFTAIWQALQEHDGKNWETEEELLPSGHQAPKHKPSLIITYKTVTEKHPYSHHPYFCVHTLNNPSAHPSYSYHYLLSPSTLFFAHPIVFCTSYCFALFILHILLLFLFFLPYICSCVVLLLYNSYFLFFCTVHWADLIWLHFTSGYTLYNLLCDK